MADTVKVEACNVAIEVDRSRLLDTRFLTAMGAVSDSSRDPGEKLVWYTRALEVVFKDPYKVMTQLADANGGVLDEETWNGFFNAVLEAAGSKN